MTYEKFPAIVPVIAVFGRENMNAHRRDELLWESVWAVPSFAVIAVQCLQLLGRSCSRVMILPPV